MCTVLLPPAENPIVVNKYIISLNFNGLTINIFMVEDDFASPRYCCLTTFSWKNVGLILFVLRAVALFETAPSEACNVTSFCALM